MFAKEFKLAKYPDEAKLNGAIVTWQNPSSITEATAPNGGYKDEAALVFAANAYRDVQVGHAVRRAYEKAVKDGKPFTLADAQVIAAGYVVGERKRRSGVGGSRKPKLGNRVNEQKFQSASKAKLDVLLEMGSITQEEYDTELARRAAAKQG